MIRRGRCICAMGWWLGMRIEDGGECSREEGERWGWRYLSRLSGVVWSWVAYWWGWHERALVVDTLL